MCSLKGQGKCLQERLKPPARARAGGGGALPRADRGGLFRHAVHLAQCLSFHSALLRWDAHLARTRFWPLLNHVLNPLFFSSCFKNICVLNKEILTTEGRRWLMLRTCPRSEQQSRWGRRHSKLRRKLSFLLFDSVSKDSVIQNKRQTARLILKNR